jgi:hypothetical protein
MLRAAAAIVALVLTCAAFQWVAVGLGEDRGHWNGWTVALLGGPDPLLIGWAIFVEATLLFASCLVTNGLVGFIARPPRRATAPEGRSRGGPGEQGPRPFSLSF